MEIRKVTAVGVDKKRRRNLISALTVIAGHSNVGHSRLARRDYMLRLFSAASKCTLSQIVYKCVANKDQIGGLEELVLIHPQVTNET